MAVITLSEATTPDIDVIESRLTIERDTLLIAVVGETATLALGGCRV